MKNLIFQKVKLKIYVEPGIMQTPIIPELGELRKEDHHKSEVNQQYMFISRSA